MMLDIADDLSSFTLAAGEPFLLDLILLAEDGTAEPLAGRAFALSFHDDERVAAATIDGIVAGDGGGGGGEGGAFVRFERDGALSEALFGRPLSVEIAERLRGGREVIARGRLAVLPTAAAVATLPAGATATWATKLTMRANPEGDRVATHRRVRQAATVAPPPAPPPPPPPPPPPAPPPSPPPLAGFAANGAENPALRAAVQRVRAGTARGRIVWKGDSITAGQGAGTAADRWRLTGARPARIPAVVAGLLSAGGTPALDGSLVCDNGIRRATGQSLATDYDPRIALVADGGQPWEVQGAAELAGGGFWRPGTDRLTFAPAAPVDMFELVAYLSNDETYRVTIDGAAPADGAASFATRAGGGFVRHVVRAGQAGARVLGIAGTTRLGALRSVTAWHAAVPALDMLVHAALGAQAGHQAATGSGWSHREALLFDAPDLTVVMLGLNDMAGNVGAASYATHLSAIVAAGRQSGDVLLVFPPAAGGAYNRDVAAYREAAAGVARQAGIAFLDLWAHFGPFDAALAARMADGEVHPDAGFAADIAAVIHRALRLMAPAIG